MENVHRLLQLLARRCYRWVFVFLYEALRQSWLTVSNYSRRENLLLSWRSQSGSSVDGTDSPHHAPNGRAWSGIVMWLVVVGSRQRHDGLGREWSWRQLHIRRWGKQSNSHWKGEEFTKVFRFQIVAKFLAKHDFDLICRAHQVVEDGYEFFAKRQLVTLFSAPNYCGEFDNAGEFLKLIFWGSFSREKLPVREGE